MHVEQSIIYHFRMNRTLFGIGILPSEQLDVLSSDITDRGRWCGRGLGDGDGDGETACKAPPGAPPGCHRVWRLPPRRGAHGTGDGLGEKGTGLITAADWCCCCCTAERCALGEWNGLGDLFELYDILSCFSWFSLYLVSISPINRCPFPANKNQIKK